MSCHHTQALQIIKFTSPHHHPITPLHRTCDADFLRVFGIPTSDTDRADRLRSGISSSGKKSLIVIFKLPVESIPSVLMD